MTARTASTRNLVQLGHATPEQIIRLGPSPNPAQLGLVVEGRPDVRLIDAHNGQQLAVIPVGADVKTSFFYTRVPYVLIVRFGGAAEVWDTHEQRRVLGPVAV